MEGRKTFKACPKGVRQGQKRANIARCPEDRDEPHTGPHQSRGLIREPNGGKGILSSPAFPRYNVISEGRGSEGWSGAPEPDWKRSKGPVAKKEIEKKKKNERETHGGIRVELADNIADGKKRQKLTQSRKYVEGTEDERSQGGKTDVTITVRYGGNRRSGDRSVKPAAYAKLGKDKIKGESQEGATRKGRQIHSAGTGEGIPVEKVHKKNKEEKKGPGSGR